VVLLHDHVFECLGLGLLLRRRAGLEVARHAKVARRRELDSGPQRPAGGLRDRVDVPAGTDLRRDEQSRGLVVLGGNELGTDGDGGGRALGPQAEPTRLATPKPLAAKLSPRRRRQRHEDECRHGRDNEQEPGLSHTAHPKVFPDERRPDSPITHSVEDIQSQLGKRSDLDH